MHPGEHPSGPASSHATWSAANSLIDQNAALWASLRPPARPSWPVLVRQRVSELSLAAVGERLHVGLPRWFGTRQNAQRWLLSATAGIVLGLGLGVAGRFSEGPPPELDDPPSAAERVVAPEAAPPTPAPDVARSLEPDAPKLAEPGAPKLAEPDAPKPDALMLAEPAQPKRAAVSKKKRLKAKPKRRTQKKTARKRKRALSTSR